jgi:hypothetical protein
MWVPHRDLQTSRLIERRQGTRESPAQVLAKQKETLGAAKSDMAALGADALAALSASRTAGVQKAEGQQGGMVQSEDQMRTNAGTEAKNAFTAAQTAVDGLLKGLPEKQWPNGRLPKTFLSPSSRPISKSSRNASKSGIRA